MRRIIMVVALLATGFAIGASEQPVRAWQPGHQVWKHFTVSEGEFGAKLEIEGVGSAGMRGLAHFSVDQRYGSGRVVIDAVGQAVLNQKLTTIRIILVAEGDKD